MTTTSKVKPYRPTVSFSKLMMECRRCAIYRITPYLFIAPYDALLPSKMRELGITHAVDASNNRHSRRVPGIEYLEISIPDEESAKLDIHFEKVADFVEAAKNKGGKTCVNCVAGISRSATLCIMSIFFIENCSLRDAYITVLRARPCIDPNTGFWRQMIEVERERYGKATIELKQAFGRQLIPDVYFIKEDIIKGTAS